jgi:hypothetical protein
MKKIIRKVQTGGPYNEVEVTWINEDGSQGCIRTFGIQKSEKDIFNDLFWENNWKDCRPSV